MTTILYCTRMPEKYLLNGVVRIARVKLIHLLIVFMLALGAFSALFWPSHSSRVNYWQDRLFSPGPVSIAHQIDADGNRIFCRGCHQPGKAINNSTCWACHDRKYFVENRPLLADSHQLFNQKDRCLRCHVEHNGDYMALSFSGFTAQVHRQLPVKSENCLLCHRLAGQRAHLSVINKDCRSCHQNYEWSSKFDHRQYLTKASGAEDMLRLCQKCHNRGYHYTKDPRAQQGCIFCHETWGKRKGRAVPYPEGVFGKVSIKLKVGEHD